MVLKQAFQEGQEAALQRLGARPWYDAIDRLGLPKGAPTETPDTSAQTAAVTRDLQKRYGVKPMLAGSMPLGLNIPGDVDLDFFTHVPDRQRYVDLIRNAKQDPKLRPSAYNTDHTTHSVFTAPKGIYGELPVDVAFSHGAQADAFRSALKRRSETASALSPELRQALVERKRTLKNTPFDIKGMRYKSFKQKLDAALEGSDEPTRIAREPLEKIGRILDMSQANDKSELDAFLNDPTLHGHRTPHADKVLGTGKIMSGLDALRRGHLQSYESGFLPGLRNSLELPDLSDQQLDTLRDAWLKEKPDYGTIGSLGQPRDALKGALIKHRFKDVDNFLRTQPAGEDWRREHLRIPKLSPHVFLTQGGLLKDPGYGDVGFLLRAPKAQQSPFLTLIRNEAILSPLSGLRMRTLDPKKGIVVGSAERIRELEAAHPAYTYAPEDAVHAAGKGLESLSLSEIPRRILPHAGDGTLRLLQG